ncbi:transposase [Halosquirtibacter laminarini]|uniref:Transposase n=1 Tax=Halosquirtibacter laminarini TaxID=3374600 RepID=A0AC61NBX3_9BACT|nr:transposase [Prolixibacteraceae bacterium]
MIIKDKDFNLIKIYDLICYYFDELRYYCERFSNNNSPCFTDQEVMTIYLFGVQYQEYTKINQIHKFASDYLSDWFPNLGSYQAFCNRLNPLGGAFTRLSELLLEDTQPNDCIIDQCLLDSMPIITCSGKRKGKVANEVTNKGYCSTKGVYYYGMKLHMLGIRRQDALPFPEQVLFTPASVNDIVVYKERWSEMRNRTFFEDKIYMHNEFNQQVKNQYNSEMLTPIKAIKGMPLIIKQRIKAADDLYNRAVSKIRQPIEAMFSWLIEKTDIQRASKVRSTKGLMVHAFGKLTATFLNYVLNP